MLSEAVRRCRHCVLMRSGSARPKVTCLVLSDGDEVSLPPVNLSPGTVADQQNLAEWWKCKRTSWDFRLSFS